MPPLPILLREARERSNKTCEEVGVATYGPKLYEKIEAGTHIPGKASLRKLSRLLSIRYDDLLEAVEKAHEKKKAEKAGAGKPSGEAPDGAGD